MSRSALKVKTLIQVRSASDSSRAI